MLARDSFVKAVVTRIREFCNERAPWQRQLWSTGTSLRLAEAVEAISVGRETDGLFARAVAEARESARDAAKRDPGVGSEKERSRVAALLSQEITAGSAAHETLAVFSEEVEPSYLRRWADALIASDDFGAEYVSRQVASFLLDGGSHPEVVRRWFAHHAYVDPESYTLPELLLKAAAELTETQEYEVVVPVESIYKTRQRPEGWMTDAEVSAWMRQNGFRPVADQHGGMQFHVVARDSLAAVDRARDTVEVFRSRLALGTRDSSMRTIGEIFVAGEAEPVQEVRRQRVDVHALALNEKIFANVDLDAVDAALELLSMVDFGTPAAAVGGAWAAVESLLKGPGDGGAHRVAPRVAALVACSFPRAEFTSLAWARVETASDAIAQSLSDLPTNRDRAQRAAELVSAGRLGIRRQVDLAAEARMKKILASPRAEISRVQALAQDPIWRLYRHRNLVLHSGRTDAVALRSTLRVASPLVGAAVDRIAHGWYAENIAPLRTAAIAQMQIERLETPEAPPIAAMLH